MQWKYITGYEGYYEVSNSGEVRSLDRIVYDRKQGSKHLQGCIMKQTESKNKKRNEDQGYFVVNLRKNNTSKITLVHRLVAEAFIPNPENLPTINHKDGNKHNNDVSNLEWSSYSYNNIHALQHSLRQPRGYKVLQVDLDGNIIQEFKSISEASRVTGIGRGVISQCANERIHTAGGYIWKKIGKCNDYLINESTAEDESLLEVQEQSNLKI